MGKCEIHGDAGDKKPGAQLWPQQGQRQYRNPGNGLTDDTPEDLRFSVGKPMRHFDGHELSPGPQELGNRGQDAQMERCRLEEKGKGREIVLATALSNGLEEPVTNAELASRFMLSRTCGRRTIIGLVYFWLGQ